MNPSLKFLKATKEDLPYSSQYKCVLAVGGGLTCHTPTHVSFLLPEKCQLMSMCLTLVTWLDVYVQS